MPTKVPCSCVGLSLSDRLLLSAFVDLIELPDGTRFVVSDDNSAPVVFVLEQSPVGQLWLQNATPDQVPIRVGPTTLNVLGLSMPFRLQPIRDALTAASARVRHAKAAVRDMPPPVADQLPAHRRLSEMLTLVDLAATNDLPQLVLGIPALQLTILPASNQVAVRGDGEAWEQLMSTLVFKPTLQSSLSAGAMGGAQLLSVDKFKWRLALLLSHGFLLPTLAAQTSFNLRSWPDLGRLGQNMQHMRMAALLVSRGATISELAKAASTTRDQAIAFVNACATQRILKDVAPLPSTLAATQRARLALVPTNPAPAPPEQKSAFIGLLKKLRSALNISAQR
jgi:hypothetical protein